MFSITTLHRMHPTQKKWRGSLAGVDQRSVEVNALPVSVKLLPYSRFIRTERTRQGVPTQLEKES